MILWTTNLTKRGRLYTENAQYLINISSNINLWTGSREATSKNYNMCVLMLWINLRLNSQVEQKHFQMPPPPSLSVGDDSRNVTEGAPAMTAREAYALISLRGQGWWMEGSEVNEKWSPQVQCDTLVRSTHTQKKRLQVCNLLWPSARELWDTDREPVWSLDLSNLKRWKSLTCWGWKIPLWALLFLSWATKSSLECQNSEDYIWRQILINIVGEAK